VNHLDVVDALEAARPKLMAIAYRMLGSVVEAEDVLGDVALKWAAADQSSIEVPEAWLVTVTTRRALDVLRSARLQRESYPGVWLPEPVTTDDLPGDELERRETLTMGFLLLLERLTPIERAVLVMHDVLEYPYDTVAEAVGRSEAACR
jgi:RNA polymerase sigma-70 factor, ECF subfamily